MHWDGTSWKNVPTGVNLDLTDVWARNTNDVWATAGARYMMHYTGTAGGWVKVDTGNADLNVLVWGTANKVYVATKEYYVLVFSGGTWTKQILNGARTDTSIGAITGTADNDVWAFGADNFICHYVTGWSCSRGNITTEINFTGTNAAIALSPTNIWEATNSGFISNSTTAATTGFAYPVSGNRVPGSSSNGLWGTASNSLFTNGQGALLYRYNGTAWSPFDAGVKDIVNMAKVHGTSATDVWSVGKRGVIVHFNGTAASANRGNIFNGTNITGVWASGANDAWFTTSGGTVLHYDGAAFRESDALVKGGGAALSSVYGLSANDIWAGGDRWHKPGDEALGWGRPGTRPRCRPASWPSRSRRCTPPARPWPLPPVIRPRASSSGMARPGRTTPAWAGR